MTPGFRSLIHRFLFALAGLMVMAVIALLSIERFVFMPPLLEGEQKLAATEVSRINNALEQNRNSLLAQTRDWAHWDDTYDFVQGGKEDYTSANFSREMFEDLQDQAMIFFDENQQVLWVAGIDPDTGNYATCTQAVNECSWAEGVVGFLRPHLTDTDPSGRTLNLATPWPSLAAIAPILRTDRSGPQSGWLVKLRLIDSRLTGMLQEQTGLPVTISALVPGQASEFLLIRETDQLHASLFIRTDTAGPALKISTTIARERFRRAVQIFHYSLAWTAVLLLVVIGLVLALVAGLVLKPLSEFSHFTRSQQRISPLLQNDAFGNVPATLRNRKDEFGTLARHFQRLLDRQKSQAQMLLKLSQHDPLTGLANRRLFDEKLQQTLDDQADKSVSVMMVDIDHFKLYNDHYGHPTGDSCLIQISEGMEDSMTDPDFLVARTGGEEFSVLLPGVPMAQALDYAETLRKAVMELAVPHADSPVAKVVTVSVGVTSTDTINKRSGSALMRCADLALYQAKEHGRNSVAPYVPDSSAVTS